MYGHTIIYLASPSDGRLVCFWSSVVMNYIVMNKYPCMQLIVHIQIYL